MQDDVVSDEETGAEGARRSRLLEAAMGVFMRYGFRKTSMEEIARAAQVSRPGLYLHFANKEALLTATIEHALDVALAESGAALTDLSLPLQERLIGALDAWVGRYVGMMGAGAAELAEIGAQVTPLYDARLVVFLERLEAAIAADPLSAAYQAIGVTPAQLTRTLYATARGLKYSAQTRAEFVEQISTAARIVCLYGGV
jgi:AcrR family transcriptional regulator